MSQFIVPVEKFEQQIAQIVADIKRSGYLVFFYGISGIGKSVFLSSLDWRSHLPIREIIHIDASNYGDINRPELKLKQLCAELKKITQKEENYSSSNKQITCVIIDYLETLDDEDSNYIKSFFRDLNPLLRRKPILVVWPVTNMEDIDKMRAVALTVANTIFHRRFPFIEFTGPAIENYPTIAKNTISVLNNGLNYDDFQLSDDDLNNIKNKYQSYQEGKRTIRAYLRDIKEKWENKTGRISKIMATIPRPTEVWFVVCYPESEDVVAQFVRKSYDHVDDNWNVIPSKLSEYIKNNTEMKELWPSSEKLFLALGVLKPKILYLPTNTLVSCVSAYSKDAEIPIDREKFQNWGVPKKWFQKSEAKRTLKISPLYLQLANLQPRVGKRRSGKVQEALAKAAQVFTHINQYISKEGSDQPFNRALTLALNDIFEDCSELSFSSEQNHPFLKTKRTDILVKNISKNKDICIEIYYTNKTQDGVLARYILTKLEKYYRAVTSNQNNPFIPGFSERY
ncbi:hypothetical protein [Okeania sp. SIO2B3]|uniref:hypothetical protein n=1 Tax=Okeania sp. SIO2B3 TaxID=2607784 RepID=UPI0013C182B7|nr:hypothetical protein [Okeania sp. SIO2B3]NET43327.1 ATP-binding protein [Okeania sp. SIO2B3]